MALLFQQSCKNAYSLLKQHTTKSAATFLLTNRTPSTCNTNVVCSSGCCSHHHQHRQFITTTSTTTRPATATASATPALRKNLFTFETCNLVPRRGAHAKSEGDQQFIEFLSTEIKAERRDSPAQSPTISGFNIEPNGPKVKLTKKYQNETVTVEFNVSDSVASPEVDVTDEESSMGPPEMVSHPEFNVTLQKDGHSMKLCINCSMLDASESAETSAEDEMDAFTIHDVAMVEGEWGENTYSVSADILDPTMYDMLMLMLEERGVNQTSFCDELVEFSTDYERKIYIGMLESLQQYVQK